MNIAGTKAAFQDHTIAKAISILLLSFIVPFYMAFGVENLWNWFVAEALHATEISLWQALGLTMLIYLLTDHAVDEKENWKQLFVILEACVPNEDLDSVAEVIEESKLYPWLKIASPALEKAVQTTFILGFGWAVHTFLM